MSRKSKTVATFAVKLTIPVGASVPMVQEYIKDAVQGWRGGFSPSPMDELGREEDVITVTILKKETTYETK